MRSATWTSGETAECWQRRTPLGSRAAVVGTLAAGPAAQTQAAVGTWVVGLAAAEVAAAPTAEETGCIAGRFAVEGHMSGWEEVRQAGFASTEVGSEMSSDMGPDMSPDMSPTVAAEKKLRTEPWGIGAEWQAAGYASDTVGLVEGRRAAGCEFDFQVVGLGLRDMLAAVGRRSSAF